MSDEPLTSAFTTMRARILQFASRFFPDRDDAEDALSDAFCRLWPQRNSINTISHAEAAAKITIRNIGINNWRIQAKDPKIRLDDIPDTPEEPSTSDIRERFDAVSQIINSQLSKTQQTIVRMHDYEQQDYSEIAEKLSMTNPQVRMQLSRARHIIRECYLNLSQQPQTPTSNPKLIENEQYQ